MKSNKKIKAYLLRLLTKKKNLPFNLKKSKKVLILKYDRIGDMVVTTPIFRELKNAYPNIRISVLASEENKDVIRYNPYIDKIYTNYKNSILKDLPTLLKLRKKSFDVCIELEHSVIPHAIFRLKIINPKKIIVVTMCISGALAGLVGINELMGVQHRLLLDFNYGYGFGGIAVALMGRNHPIGIIIAALLFGILYQGGMDLAFEMQSVSRHIIVVMQGLVILFCGGLEYLYRPILIRFLAPIEASE